MAISLEQAQIIATAGLAKARELALKPVSVVVLDPRATLVVVLSEDGVSMLRPRIAQGKANAAVAMGMGTRALIITGTLYSYRPGRRTTIRTMGKTQAVLKFLLARYLAGRISIAIGLMRTAVKLRSSVVSICIFFGRCLNQDQSTRCIPTRMSSSV